MGQAHRFAGSGDRNAIGGLVYDALRQRGSIAWAMANDEARALALGAAAGALGITPQAVIEACDGSTHAPSVLNETERAGLTRISPARRRMSRPTCLSGCLRVLNTFSEPAPSTKAAKWPSALRRICVSTRSRRRGKKC